MNLCDVYGYWIIDGSVGNKCIIGRMLIRLRKSNCGGCIKEYNYYN